MNLARIPYLNTAPYFHFFSPRWLSEQMKNFNRHPHLFFKELWALLVLEIWFRHFIEGDLSEP